MKHLEIKKYVVLQKKLNLYVAESHYFDSKGKRQVTLTDDYNLAEEMTLTEANRFLSSGNNSKNYIILEASEDDLEEEEIDEE